jgi:hypothetical protein
VQARLAEMGHTVVAQVEAPNVINFGRVNAIRRDPKTGMLHAATYPAWNTGGAGY